MIMLYLANSESGIESVSSRYGLKYKIYNHHREHF
jgi:hypothetical protein